MHSAHKNSCFLFAGFLVPLPAVIVALVGHSRYRYSVRFFPPQLSICAPNDLDFWFYTLIVPLGFLNGAGIFMLMMVIWLLHKVMNNCYGTPLHTLYGTSSRFLVRVAVNATAILM